MAIRILNVLTVWPPFAAEGGGGVGGKGPTPAKFVERVFRFRSKLEHRRSGLVLRDPSEITRHRSPPIDRNET